MKKSAPHSVSFTAFFEALPRLICTANSREREAFLASVELAARGCLANSRREKVRGAARHVLRACEQVRQAGTDERPADYLVLALVVCHDAESRADQSRAAASRSASLRPSSSEEILSAARRLEKRVSPRKLVSEVRKAVRVSEAYARKVLKKSGFPKRA